MLVPKLTFMYRSGCTDIFYVPKVIVPILTFNVPKLYVPKKHVLKVYVPKLSCTESDLPPATIQIRVRTWLADGKYSAAMLKSILSSKQTPCLKHRIHRTLFNYNPTKELAAQMIKCLTS